MPEVASVRAIATLPVTLSGPQTVDTVALVTGDRVALAGQTNETENGIYDVQTLAWTRSPDMGTSADFVYGTRFLVREGSPDFEDSEWYIANKTPPVLGTDPIELEMRSFATPRRAGAGLVENGTLWQIGETGVLPGTYASPLLKINERGLIDGAAASETSSTFLEGLRITTPNASTLRMSPGAAFVPDLGRILESPGDLDYPNPNNLSPNATYYCYIYEDAGLAALEVSSLAPATPYRGDARVKGPDTAPDSTRRYRGEVYTTSTGAFSSASPAEFATEVTDGIVRFASDAQSAAGTLRNRVIHPAGLGAALLTPPLPEGFIAPSITGGWSNVGGGNEPVGYYKDRSGRVHLRGLVTGGLVGTTITILTLQVGYRPAFIANFSPWNTGSVPARVLVDVDGTVRPIVASNTQLSLAGISFRAG